MNKKYLVYILAIVLVLVIVMIISFSKKENQESQFQEEQATIEKNETTEEYVVYDQNGNIIANSVDEDSLEIYKIDPTYNPDPTGTLSN